MMDQGERERIEHEERTTCFRHEHLPTKAVTMSRVKFYLQCLLFAGMTPFLMAQDCGEPSVQIEIVAPVAGETFDCGRNITVIADVDADHANGDIVISLFGDGELIIVNTIEIDGTRRERYVSTIPGVYLQEAGSYVIAYDVMKYNSFTVGERMSLAEYDERVSASAIEARSTVTISCSSM